jgi:hypothetical protein
VRAGELALKGVFSVGFPASLLGGFLYNSAGKMGGAMWLWALGQQTERIKSLRPSLLLNPRLLCYYKH